MELRQSSRLLSLVTGFTEPCRLSMPQSFMRLCRFQPRPSSIRYLYSFLAGRARWITPTAGQSDRPVRRLLSNEGYPRGGESMESEFYTTHEFAQLMGCGDTKAREILQSVYGPPRVRIGRKWRVRKEGFQEWLREFTNKTKPLSL